MHERYSVGFNFYSRGLLSKEKPAPDPSDTDHCFFDYSACGSDPAPVADLQWRINYGDWTDDNSEDDYRGCDNAPEINARGIPYPVIDRVHVHLTDPAGVIPGYDQRVDCDIGIGSGTLTLRGLVRQAWDVTISAEAADGTILYQYVQEEVDMSTPQTFTYELQAKTSETHYIPLVQDRVV